MPLSVFINLSYSFLLKDKEISQRNKNSSYFDNFVPRKVIFKCLLGAYLKILRPHKAYSKIPMNKNLKNHGISHF